MAGEIKMVALGPDYDNSHVGYLFASERDSSSWTRSLRVTDRVKRLREKIAVAGRKGTNDAEQINRARRDEQRLRSSLERLSAKIGLPIGSEDLLRRAITNRPAGELPVSDSAILHADANYTGRWLPVYQDWPDLRWFIFNDVTISIQGFGEGALFSDAYYRGRIFRLLAFPAVVFSIPWLSAFNDITSSVMVYS